MPPENIILGIAYLITGAAIIYIAVQQWRAEQENKAKNSTGGK